MGALENLQPRRIVRFVAPYAGDMLVLRARRKRLSVRRKTHPVDAADRAEEEPQRSVAVIANGLWVDRVAYAGILASREDASVGKRPLGALRGIEDERGQLFFDYIRILKEFQPKFFLAENVSGMLANRNSKAVQNILWLFEEAGYDVSLTLVNAKDYGIPQNRERLFVVGFRSDLKLKQDFQFPKPIPLEKTMQDFLMDNAPGGYFLPKKGVAFVTMEKNLNKRFTQIDGDIALCQKKNQEFNWHGDFVFQSEEDAKKNDIPDLEKYFLSEKVKKYVLSSGTKNFYSKPATDLEVARPLLTTMHKMHRAGVDNYVTTEGRLRKLTPRECLRLMGFSDDWKIVVSDTAMYQQAGNSIVVDVLIHIMNEILKCYPSLIDN